MRGQTTSLLGVASTWGLEQEGLNNREFHSCPPPLLFFFVLLQRLLRFFVANVRKPVASWVAWLLFLT